MSLSAAMLDLLRRIHARDGGPFDPCVNDDPSSSIVALRERGLIETYQDGTMHVTTTHSVGRFGRDPYQRTRRDVPLIRARITPPGRALLEGGPAPTFYLTQFGGVWRATSEGLRTLFERALHDGAYDLDNTPGITRLRERFSEASFDRREGFLPKRWRSPDRILLMPLDRPASWFAEMADAFRRRDWDAMRGATPLLGE